jgi:DNA-binding LacI/PurR family transcriptional regulator
LPRVLASIKTASNVVNGYVHVAPQTRARVQHAIDALGYQPNMAARQLRIGRSGAIALALPELQSPYFAEIAGRIVQAAERRSWTVLIDQTDGQAERERNLVAGLRRHAIDGLIFSPLALAGEELTSNETPMVLLGEHVWHGPADHVAIDNTAAAADATRHLAELGRRRIAAIGAQDRPSAVTAHQRLAGYRLALTAGGLPADPRLVAEVDRGRSLRHPDAEYDFTEHRADRRDRGRSARRAAGCGGRPAARGEGGPPSRPAGKHVRPEGLI